MVRRRRELSRHSFREPLMNSPLVSIVVPVFNGERYLHEALDACLCQAYSNWELIAVDDASNDRTPEILEKYRNIDERIRVVRHDVNRLLPAALNTGFSLARGDFLTWTSDDNIYRSEALMVMVEHLNARPDMDIVYADFTLIDESEGCTRKIIVSEPERIPISNCVGPCFLYRRSVHDTLGGYDEKMFLAEDYDFWLRAWQKFSFGKIHQDLYLYRNHELSLTSQKRMRVVRTTARVRARFYARAKNINSTVKARGWIHQVDSAILCGKAGLATVYMLRAILSNSLYVLRYERRIFKQILNLIYIK